MTSAGKQSEMEVKRLGSSDPIDADCDHTAIDSPDSIGIGALKQCDARVKRLDALSRLLESFADPLWTSSEDIDQLSMALKQNAYLPAIRNRMLSLQLTPYESCSADSALLRGLDTPWPGQDSVLQRARLCGPDIVSEISSLRSLEEQASSTTMKMLTQMSEDIPLCVEEARTAMSKTRSRFNPARSELADAVDRILVKKESSTAQDR